VAPWVSHGMRRIARSSTVGGTVHRSTREVNMARGGSNNWFGRLLHGEGHSHAMVPPPYANSDSRTGHDVLSASMDQ
jgi:hypothetical protein